MTLTLTDRQRACLVDTANNMAIRFGASMGTVPSSTDDDNCDDIRTCYNALLEHLQDGEGVSGGVPGGLLPLEFVAFFAVEMMQGEHTLDELREIWETRLGYPIMRGARAANINAILGVPLFTGDECSTAAHNTVDGGEERVPEAQHAAVDGGEERVPEAQLA
jgi:hypothetical protein